MERVCSNNGLAINGVSASATHLRALALHRRGRFAEALPLLRRSIELDPAQPDFHANLGVVLAELGQLNDALATFKAALALKPDHVNALHGLGITLEKLSRLPEAADAYRSLAQLQPKDPEPRAYLSKIALHHGDLDQALHWQREELRLGPNDPRPASGYLFNLLHSHRPTPQQLFHAHVDWANRFADPLFPKEVHFDNDRNPHRCLRVGYLSSGLREHTGARFIAPVLAHHDPEAVETIVYCDVTKPDALTARFRAMKSISTWREVAHLDDEQLARQIREDQIDILVEAIGHMDGNRLLCLARKPAPIIVTRPGYPATTGMKAIDYCITDDLRDLPGTDDLYVEKLVRLPISAQSFDPLSDVDAIPAPSPARATGQITFASLNKPMKLTPPVIQTWAAILRALPCSRMMLLVHRGDPTGSFIASQFASQGIAPDRLILQTRLPRRDYLALHNQIDINLDPWPYNGHTTILDGLWMGIPAIALQGQTHVSREASAALMLVGLPELIANSSDEYIQIAAALAKDLPRLNHLRSTIRDRLCASPLMDGPGLARRLEAAYRQIWREWCSQ